MLCVPEQEKLVSREQEAVVGTWRKLTDSQVDFDEIWKNMPHREQYHSTLSAFAIGYEALSIKGKFRRVSPASTKKSYSNVLSLSSFRQDSFDSDEDEQKKNDGMGSDQSHESEGEKKLDHSKEEKQSE